MSDERKERLIKVLDEIWEFYEGEELTRSEFLRSDYKRFDGKESRKNREKAGKIEFRLDEMKKKIQQIRKHIQQQPEIDDMKKYVAEKEMELFDAIIKIEDIDGTVNKHFLNSGKIGMEKRKKFITQIIKDTKGGGR